MKHLFTIALAISSFTAIQAQKLQTTSFGKGINFMAADSSFTMKMNFRFQSLYSGEYDIQGEEFESNFLIRRSRLKFGGYAYSPKLKYKVELGLSNRDMSVSSEDGNGKGASRMILDAVLKYQFHKNWSLWAGQTKLPGNRERLVSSANLQFVDRSNVNSKFNIDRDMGIQLHGKYKIGDNFILAPKFALAQGEGRDIASGNFGGYSYTGRLDILPLGAFEGKKEDYILSDHKRQSKPKLAIGLFGNLNQGAVRQQGQLGKFVYDTTGEYANNDLTLIGADLLFKYKGFSILSEFGMTDGVMKNDMLNEAYHTGTGFNAQAGYLFENNVELAGRFTTVSPDDKKYSGLKETEEWTLAFSRYFVGHNLKIQTDASWIATNDSQETFRVRAQVEMQF